MKHFIFKTTATMKEYNSRKWWIDGGIITEKHIFADTIPAALEEYRQLVEDQHYVNISDHAIKHRQPMYIDTKAGEPLQVGFVLTGSTEFEYSGGWSKQYIDLWVEVLTVTETEF